MPEPRLVQVMQMRDYLDVDHQEDDRLIRELIVEAEAMMVRFIGTSILSLAYLDRLDGSKSRIWLTSAPVQSGTLVVTDTQGSVETGDDVVLDASLYRVDYEMGRLTRTSANGARMCWEPGVERWQVSYTAGLELLRDWATGAEEELRSSIRLMVRDMYDNRDPSLKVEGFGGGVNRHYDIAGLPTRVEAIWSRYLRRVGV